jgi:hypothetical protein
VLKIDKSSIDDISNLQDDREGRLPPLLLMGHILGFKLLAEAFVPLLRAQESDILCSFTQCLRDFYHEDTKKKPG